MKCNGCAAWHPQQDALSCGQAVTSKQIKNKIKNDLIIDDLSIAAALHVASCSARKNTPKAV